MSRHAQQLHTLSKPMSSHHGEFTEAHHSGRTLLSRHSDEGSGRGGIAAGRLRSVTGWLERTCTPHYTDYITWKRDHCRQFWFVHFGPCDKEHCVQRTTLLLSENMNNLGCIHHIMESAVIAPESRDQKHRDHRVVPPPKHRAIKHICETKCFLMPSRS